MHTKKNFSAKISTFVLISALSLSQALPFSDISLRNTNTLSPSSYFNKSFFTSSLQQQAFLKDGKWFLKETNAAPQAIIYEIFKDEQGNIISTKEIFNSFTSRNKISYNKKTDKFIFQNETNTDILTPADEKGNLREFKVFTHNFTPRYDQWLPVLIEKNHLYPPIEVFKKELISFIQKTPGNSLLEIGDKKINTLDLEKRINRDFKNLNANDLCLLYDLFKENSNVSPYTQYNKIKEIEKRFTNKKQSNTQVTQKSEASNQDSFEKSEFKLWLDTFSNAITSNMSNMVSPDREPLSGTYEINFNEKIQAINPYTDTYQDFKLDLVKKLSNNISTYGGSMHKQVREKFLSAYNLPAYHSLYPNTKRNASEIDNILGVSTIQGRGRYSNTMTDNPNSWIESLTYLFKEQNYDWQDKVNEDLKSIFPEFSAISVFDIKKTNHKKTICFPFASVAEILAMWAQVNATETQSLPEYITSPSAWVNHWKKDVERKKLVSMHLTYIKQTLKETNFVKISDPNLKGSYKTLDALIDHASFEDQIYILKQYIHLHLPKFKEPKDLINDIHTRIGVPKEDIILADMVFLDPGLYNNKVGMPQYIEPSIIFMLSDPEVFNKTKTNTEANPAHTAASYLKDIGISAKAITLNHYDKTPFVSAKNQNNRKLQDIETTIMMLLTTLSLDNVTADEKLSLISRFNQICDQAEPLYQNTDQLKEALKNDTCYDFIPQKLIPSFKLLTEKEQDTEKLLEILNYVRLNGLEKKFTKISASISNKDVFLHVFRNGNLKSMLETTVNEQFISIQKNKLTSTTKPRIVEAPNAKDLKEIKTLTGDTITLKEKISIPNITDSSEDDSNFVKSVKEDTIQALTILKKQKMNPHLSALLTKGDISIKLFSPTEDILVNYFEKGRNNLYFLSEDKTSLYIDYNFWQYTAKDNLTKTNAIACILAESLSQFDLSAKDSSVDLATAAKAAQQQILPGTTIKNITGRYFSRLLAENNDYLQKKKEEHSIENLDQITFYQGMRHGIQKTVQKLINGEEVNKYDFTTKLKSLKKLIQFSLLNPNNKLSPQHNFLSSFFDLSSIQNIIYTVELIENGQKPTDTQAQVLKIFLKEMDSVEKYISNIQKTRQEILHTYGTDVVIDKAYKHRSDTVYEISLNPEDPNKNIDIEKLIALISSTTGETFKFSGFNKGFCTWKNTSWKKYSANKLIIKGTNITPTDLNSILQHTSDLNEETMSTLLSNSGNIYNITPDPQMRKQILTTNLNLCSSKEDVLTEAMRYVLCSPKNTLNIHSDLSYVLAKAMHELYIHTKHNKSSNETLIQQTWSSLKETLKEQKKTPQKSMLKHFEKKDFIGKAILNFFRDFKKAELHRHITGSISPNMILEMFWVYPQARREFLYKFAGFDKEKIESLSQEKIDNVFVKYTKAKKLSSKKNRTNLTELVQLKNNLQKQSIAASRKNNWQAKQTIDTQIKNISIQIEDLYGGETARNVINNFIEYRPTEKIGVSIMEYLDKLEIAKLFLSYDDSLDVMRKYAFQSVYEDYAFDNITLTELRTSGVRPGSPYTLDQTVKAYIDGLLDAEDLSGKELSTGYILCMFKDLQNEIKPEFRQEIKDRVASEELENMPLLEVYKDTMSKAKKEIERDYPNISLAAQQELMEEEIHSFGKMIEDSLLQLSFGRGEDFNDIAEKFNFRPKPTDAISDKDKESLKKIVNLFEKVPKVKPSVIPNLIKRIEALESAPYIIKSLKAKIVLFEAVREEHLNQVKQLLEMKEKWAASDDPMDHRRAEKIVAIDAVWSELDEIVYPSLPAFRYAKKHGLNTTYHIGESWKEGEFKSALKRLQRIMDYPYIDRIGHGTALGVFINNLGGIYSHEERSNLKEIQSSLINHPSASKVVLESCPTSNVYLTEDLIGYQQHVSSFFMNRNFNVVLAEDNGRVLHTNGLSAEITRVWMTNPEINFSEVINLIANSFAFSFNHSADDVKTIKDLRDDPSSSISLKNISQHIANVNSIVVSDSIILHQDKSNISAITLNDNLIIPTPKNLYAENLKGVYYFYDNNTKENLYIITKDTSFSYDFRTGTWSDFANTTPSSDSVFLDLTEIKTAA